MAKPRALLTTTHIRNFYNRIIDLVFAVILLFTALTMVIGVVRLFYRVGDLLKEGGITGSYLYIFADVLTLFILIELSRSLMEYFTSHRIRFSLILDAGMIFVLRHIMIDIFQQKIDPQIIYALSFLLLALGAIRIGTSLTFQREKREVYERDQDRPAESQ